MDVEDLHIRDEVLAELDFDPVVDASTIDVGVQDGAVTLSGFVRLHIEKAAAGRAARRVSGVRALAENLEVRPPGMLDRLTDSELADYASHLLRWATSAGRLMTIAVRGGRIHLSGAVDFHYQRQEAQRALGYLPGVVAVTDATTLRRRPLSAGAGALILGALRRSDELAEAVIQVDVEGAQVTLGGAVATWRQRELAEDIAWALAGVTAVRNNIVVLSRRRS